MADSIEQGNVRFARTLQPPKTEVTIDFSDLGSGASDTVALPLPDDCFVVAAELEITTAVTVGGGDTTGLTLIAGISGGDTDSLVESIDLVGLAAGKHRVTLGAQLCELCEAASTFVLTLTATGGSTELDHVDAGNFTLRFFRLGPSD